MLELDTKLIHSDILKKLNAMNKSQRYFIEKFNFSKSFFWRLSKGKDISMKTFLTVLNWIEKDPSRYIKQNEKKSSIHNSSS